MRYSYLNGQIVRADKAKIDPYDLGFLRAYGVFDVMRTFNGKPFLLAEHFERLENSAKEFNLTLPVDKNKFEKIVKKLLIINKYQESNVRTVLTGGVSIDGFTKQPGNETFLILIEKLSQLPKQLYKTGAKAITLNYRREFPYSKTTNYQAAIKNQEKKFKQSATEIIYFDDDKLLEASTSSVCLVVDGKVLAPKNDVLFGTTRDFIIKLARKQGLRVEEREITKEEFFSTDEIFLTGTTKGVLPITEVDGELISSGKIGGISKMLMKEFENHTKKY